MVLKDELDSMLDALGSGHLIDDKDDKVIDDKTNDADVVDDTKNKDVIDNDLNDKDIIDDTNNDNIIDDTDDKVIDDKDKIIEDLRSKVAELEAVKREPIKKIEPTKKEDIVKEDPIAFEEQDFIGEQDIDDIVRDKAEFNKLLNSVYTKGITDARSLISERVLLSIPDIVRNNIDIVTKLKDMSEKFYETNKDLVPFKKVVATVFSEIASDNPDKDYLGIMELVAPEVRKRLDLITTTIDKDKGNNGKGKLPKLPMNKGGGQRNITKPNISPIQNEIDEMNKIIRR